MDNLNKDFSFPCFFHGGDYNPEQWLDMPEIIEKDFELMDQARCNVFSIGVFAWGKLEPKEGEFDFSWLDHVMDLCQKHGKKVLLATATGARPAWLAQTYSETSRILRDGSREMWKDRENHCYSSPMMRKYAGRIIQKLAERYAKHPALFGWHVSNEYNGECFCPLCMADFHKYLQEKYKTLDAFNKAAWSAFWSHGYSDWTQIDPRDETLDILQLEWKRFVTKKTVDFMKFEVENIRRFSNAPVTTNFMGFFDGLDYWRFNEVCDFIANDSYPSWDKGNPLEIGARVAMAHDFNYTMKHKPFLMIESCPEIPEWCGKKLRRPGEFEREMILALGHGADGTMYFQWRKGRGGFEKIHGAVVGHDGSNQTNVFKRVENYGKKLEQIAEVQGATINAECAVIYDWESRWALNATCGFEGFPGQNKDKDMPLVHYGSLWACNVSVAVIEQLSDFSPYRLIVVPSLYMLKSGVAKRLMEFVENGGILVVSSMSAVVDETNRVFLNGLPGDGLREFCGVWSEDVDSPAPGEQKVHLTKFTINGENLFPVIGRAEIIHAEDAEVLATYELDFYEKQPAITRKKVGKGLVYYIAADLGPEFLTEFYLVLLKKAKIEPVISGMPEYIRVSKRSKEGKHYYFFLNFSNEIQRIPLPWKMDDIWNGRKNVEKIDLNPNMGTVLSSNR